MGRKASTKIPYLHRRADTPGWYFMRRVPLDLKEQVGKQAWRRLLAYDITSARLKLPGAIAETDKVIAQLRGKVSPSEHERPHHHHLTHQQDRLLLQGRPGLIRELLEVGAPLPDDVAELADLPQITCGYKPTSLEEILELAIRLKRPAPQTILIWERTLKEFTKYLTSDHLQLTTRQDAANFRDHLLSKGLKVSTIRLRLSYLTGLFAVAVEEELLSMNPFQGVAKRLRSDDARVIVSLDVEAIDISKLPLLQQYLFNVLRFTGCRLAEAAGLELGDIDLEQDLIHIRPKPDRPLKTRESCRVVPVHSKLKPTLKELMRGNQRPWESLYNTKTLRWGNSIKWGDKNVIGCNPHRLRHHVVSCLRSAGFAETVIGRLVGHRVSGITASYGTVSVELLRAAIESVR
jgi:integrase